MKITYRQARAGRILSGLTLRELSDIAKLSPTTVHRFEIGRTLKPRILTIEAVCTALERNGIEFSDHGWVRHRDDDPASESFESSES